MEKVEQYDYQKINYQRYCQELTKILQNNRLQQLGIKKTIVGTTAYGYPIDCITIGNGTKEIFLVGGTHGSEVISVDFLLNFIKELPNSEEFDPNIFKIIVIPLQNPEGFDISTNTFNDLLDENFEKDSKEYYLRYRTDSLIIKAISELNKTMREISIKKGLVPAKYYLDELILFTKTNASWKNLYDVRAIPKFQKFNYMLENLPEPTDYKDLRIKLINLCNVFLDKESLVTMSDAFLYLLVLEIKNSFSNDNLWEEITNEKQQKLYQKMFENKTFDGLTSKRMMADVERMYQDYNHPKGSQIGHDSTGTGINLNANQPLSPGIISMKDDIVVYGPFVKNNVRNYVPGPLGIPTVNPYNFEYSVENSVVENMIKESFSSGRYLTTILYHGTGGQIFYKPYSELMDESTYSDYLSYNEDLASIYSASTNYQLLSSSGSTGYGDYLRRTYPGVLMVELSKMGGNPIGPYGDKNNIYRTFNENNQALNSVLAYFKTKTKIK